MITIKDYAKNNSVSYEAVRRQVRALMPKIEGHITKQNRTMYLDEYAVEVLDSHRKQKVVSVVENGENRLEMLEAELQHKEEMEALQRRIDALQGQVIKLQEEKTMLLEERAESMKLLSESTEKTKRSEDENDKLREELSSFQRTFFGFYRKK